MTICFDQTQKKNFSIQFFSLNPYFFSFLLFCVLICQHNQIVYQDGTRVFFLLDLVNTYIPIYLVFRNRFFPQHNVIHHDFIPFYCHCLWKTWKLTPILCRMFMWWIFCLEKKNNKLSTVRRNKLTWLGNKFGQIFINDKLFLVETVFYCNNQWLFLGQQNTW